MVIILNFPATIKWCKNTWTYPEDYYILIWCRVWPGWKQRWRDGEGREKVFPHKWLLWYAAWWTNWTAVPKRIRANTEKVEFFIEMSLDNAVHTRLRWQNLRLTYRFFGTRSPWFTSNCWLAVIASQYLALFLDGLTPDRQRKKYGLILLWMCPQLTNSWQYD